MGSYAPVSALGWLDLDAAASERVATLLKAFDEPGTLDPIGLGQVRDVFSNLLAPGTSTIQTRLRYFLFVPWICRKLEREGVPPGEFLARLRADESRLIDCLRHLGPNQGVQGYNAGRDLKRMPSEIYWGGLFSWQIRRLELSIAEYGRQVRHVGGAHVEVDDDRGVVISPRSMWTALPEPPDDFLKSECDFSMTVAETDALVDQIRRHHAGSLLAEACAFPVEAAAVEWPWDLPAARLSSETRETLHHARCVSELTLGAQLVYNLILARRARSELGWDTEEFTDNVEDDLRGWASMVGQRARSLGAWADEVDEFWGFLVPFDSVGAPTRSFVTQMVTRAAADPAAFVEDAAVHASIRDREVRLKGSRARLGSRAALEAWSQVRFGSQLAYRWPIARGYLADLAAVPTRTA